MDTINIALKHCMFPEHIKGALDGFFLWYDILEYLEIKEVLWNGEPDSS